MSKQTFYVTTPIYYGTSKPHLGSLYSTLIADVMSRWQKLQAKETFFLTGTDEHGQKIAQAAQQAGMSPQAFVGSFIAAYKEAWHTYDIQYSKFIRTTDPYHINGVQEFIKKLLDQGDIYKSLYKGWYCTPCENYVTATDAPDTDNKPICPLCSRDTVAVAEESYFFKLSAYQNKLLRFYTENPDFIVPKMRVNEVISFVESGLKDLSISRTTISWGVPFPGDSEHVVYVWVDALCNYLTAVGYGDQDAQASFSKWWPPNLQVLGKDIVRFHAVYWPALLMAAGLQLPKRLLVHGWIQINKQKMSKSRGNVVDPIELAKLYGSDPVRYYLMRQIPVNADGDFSTGDLDRCITSDLANDLGNLLNRMVMLAYKRGVREVSAPNIWSQEAVALRDEAWNMIEDYEQYFSDCEFHLGLARLWKFINQVNAYFHEQEPWKIAMQDSARFEEIVSATCHSLRIIAVLLWSIMPKKMEALLESIGHTLDSDANTLESLELGLWNQTFLLKKIPALFEKIEESKKRPEEQMKEKASEEENEYIKIDDVVKVDLRVGTIMSAESVPESEKLIKLQVDFGEFGNRQILAGLRKWYQPQDLVGKQGVFVFNLKPRKMIGMESQGMMLTAADDEGKPCIIMPESAASNGTRLK